MKACGEFHGRNKLTEAEAREVYELSNRGSHSLREIGSLFGIAQTTVRRIRDKLIWKSLWEEQP